MKVLNVNKVIKHLEDMMDENQKEIDAENDADLACYHENETLDYVLNILNNERFYKTLEKLS